MVSRSQYKNIFFLVLIIMVVLIVLVARKNRGSLETSHTFDCIPESCPELVIDGDEPAKMSGDETNIFSGFADPSIRKDPLSDRLWMAYSWPKIDIVDRRPVPGVEIHYAHSDDSGQSWQFDGQLWDSSQAIYKGSLGFIDHEVVNILPVRNGNIITWYGIRVDYFIPKVGGFKSRPVNSFHLKISQASSVEELAIAETATLGGSGTDDFWGIAQDLSKSHSDTNKCQWWNEPALYSENNSLYLAIRCMADKSIEVTKNDIMIFTTKPIGDVKNWQWEYLGKLAGAEEAKKLGGRGLTQIDITRGMDGSLLLIVSPDDYQKRLGFVHFGCRVIEIESINPPKLAKDSKGSLKIRASITASDLRPLGPGACTYDPDLKTGIIMTRRENSENSFTASMHETGVRP